MPDDDKPPSTNEMLVKVIFDVIDHLETAKNLKRQLVGQEPAEPNESVPRPRSTASTFDRPRPVATNPRNNHPIDLEETEMATCPKCNKEVESTAKFCSNCATPIVAEAPATVPQGDANAKSNAQGGWFRANKGFALTMGGMLLVALVGIGISSSRGPCPFGQKMGEVINAKGRPVRGCMDGAGRQQGTWQVVWGGKKLAEATFSDGHPQGRSTEWFENQRKKSEYTYENGETEGLGTTWYENGQKESEVHLKHGKKDGLETEWHNNGQKKAEKTYTVGVRNGPAAMWYENGQKRSEGTFKDDVLVSATAWDESGQKTVVGNIPAWVSKAGAQERLAALQEGRPMSLPVGTYAATTPEWTTARDQVIRWCNANTGKCPAESMAALMKPADGSLQTPFPPGGTGALLTTCSPANCMSGMLTSAEFTRDGQTWKISKVATESTGD